MAWFTRNLRDSETGRVSGLEIWLRARSAFAVVLSAAVLVAGVGFVTDRVQVMWTEFRTAEDYVGDGVAPTELTIPKGMPLSQIADLLVANGVIRTAKAFDREAAANADSKKIQAGRYKLLTQIPAKLALAMLLDPKNMVRDWMTLTEGQWLSTQVDQMAKATKIPKKNFEKALKKWKKLGLPTWARKGKGAEGFVFPDSYELPSNPTATGVLKMTFKQFGKVAKAIDLTGRADVLSDSENRKLTAYDLVVVASIVEREVFLPEDRPKVARVIYNRLRAGMPLGMSSTVAYAVGRSGDLGLSDEQTRVDSPYNTYRVKGLPPGPISSPGRAALEAAADPADGDWLYFVTVNPSTGETRFSDDERGFQQAKAAYEAWCEESDANHKLCTGTER